MTMQTTERGARKKIDCSQFPSESGCTLVLMGTETEVLKAAREHAVSSHGHQASPELDDALRGAMQDV